MIPVAWHFRRVLADIGAEDRRFATEATDFQRRFFQDHRSADFYQLDSIGRDIGPRFPGATFVDPVPLTNCVVPLAHLLPALLEVRGDCIAQQRPTIQPGS
jgi:hypothetical protein